MSGLAERLRERIIAGDPPPGKPLRQDAIAAELGVSKIPLREALARLEREGLLRVEANRGWFVRGLSGEEAEEIYQLRLLLEPKLAARAAESASAPEQASARRALTTLDHAAPATVGVANRAFHLALVRPAARPITLEIVERLHILSERYVRKHLEPLGRDERADAEHRALLDAWLARDGKSVASLLLDHLDQTRADLARQLAAR